MNEDRKLYLKNYRGSKEYKKKRKISDKRYRDSEKWAKIVNSDEYKKRKKLYDKEYNKKPERIKYLKEYKKKYGKNYFSLYRAKKLNATPKFANLDKIKEIYKNCPDGFHVDHIIPLNNPIVCGLHVEWNLQYLPAKENLAKGNKLLDIK